MNWPTRPRLSSGTDERERERKVAASLNSSPSGAKRNVLFARARVGYARATGFLHFPRISLQVASPPARITIQLYRQTMRLKACHAIFGCLYPGVQSKRPPFRSRNEPTGLRPGFFFSAFISPFFFLFFCRRTRYFVME